MSQGPDVTPGLRRAIADRSSIPRSNSPEAHSEALFRAHVLAMVARFLTDAGVEALLVKGAALALTVYDDPAVRIMRDIDLLVRPGENDRVIAALVAGGSTVRSEPDRQYSAPLQGETGVYVRAGSMRELVEVHTSLDKVVTRPVDLTGLFARARPAPGLPGLLVPCDEDHALLVALHAASHNFTHAAAYLDLELLLRRGLDIAVLVERARQWQLTGVMFAMLSAMRQLHAASVDDALVATFDPGPVRRALLAGAAARGAARPGWGWIVAQTPLHDDPVAWVAGVGRYAAARVRDRGATLARSREAAQDAPVTYRVPLWVRAILSLDRTAARLENARAGLRDEALLAWIPLAERAALTAAIYAEQATYLPGGHRFEGGLFTWEHEALASPTFPRSGRVLLGAAGAGRELVALVARGYEVVAFDPCEPFATAAKSVAPANRATSVHASYADLVDAVAGRGGPLADVVTGKPFDAIILGWGSLSHVVPSSARIELFRTLRTLAPDAPVLGSFGVSSDPNGPSTATGRVRSTLRRAFAALGAPGVSEESDHFFSHIGFFSYLSPADVRSLAAETGYEIKLLGDVPYGYVLLAPVKGR